MSSVGYIRRRGIWKTLSRLTIEAISEMIIRIRGPKQWYQGGVANGTTCGPSRTGFKNVAD